MASALDAGISLEAGTTSSFEEDEISGVAMVADGALELSSEQAEKRAASPNKTPIAGNTLFFIIPLLNGNTPNI
jgi:hypothetical protein